MTEAPRPSPWETAGRRSAAALDGVAAVVVVGADPSAAALVALGIGREQARRRRVAIADLVGELPPLQSLLHDDDSHGIVDSFLYGVSLNKIARQVDEIGNLFVMPSGTEPVDHAEILPSDRWRRLASGFREVEALLLIVAPVDAPGLDVLVSSTDGLVAVDLRPGAHPAGPVISEISLPRLSKAMQGPVAEPVTAARIRPRSAPGPWLVPGLAVLALVGGSAAWLLRDRAASESRAAVPAVGAVAGPAARPDSVLASEPLEALAPVNPADSASAATWSVELVNLNTQAGAALKVRDASQTAPTVTFSPVVLGADDSRWFRVTAGAFVERTQADSLMRALLARGILRPGEGKLLRAPLALLIDGAVAPPDVRASLDGYVSRGVPVYALRSGDGVIRLYAGAFETPAQAGLMAATVKAAGIRPVIAYRIGRTF